MQASTISETKGAIIKASAILLVLILSLAVISTGCTTGNPSEEDFEQAILSYLRKSTTGITDNPSRSIEAVEVIEVGESYEYGKMTVWPVKVNIVKPSSVERAEYILFRDVFGDLKILRRSASSLYGTFSRPG